MRQHPHEAPLKKPPLRSRVITPSTKIPGDLPVTSYFFSICGARTTPGPTTLFRKGGPNPFSRLLNGIVFMPVVQWDLNRGACVP
ncbi:hypothetical protein CDAR_490011 [Caerostris darwini]|uniref:Uncharacterized protein n=1 Tax=Caerostris darwini TaxID=1538125 RepID=A0AAV4TR75_9ARAC|nr:hypothetical protein CDAR_490011 [Caerostris darwini]